MYPDNDQLQLASTLNNDLLTIPGDPAANLLPLQLLVHFPLFLCGCHKSNTIYHISPAGNAIGNTVNIFSTLMEYYIQDVLKVICVRFIHTTQPS